MIQIQQLKERVTLLRRRIREQPDGVVEEEWIEVASLWARVKPLKPGDLVSGEGWDDPQIRRRSVYAVTVRFQPRLHMDRLSWRGKTYAVVSAPVVDESRVWISTLMTQIGDNDE